MQMVVHMVMDLDVIEVEWRKTLDVLLGRVEDVRTFAQLDIQVR